MTDVRGARQAAGEETAGLLMGASFTFALFFGMAYFETFRAPKPIAQIEDVRTAAVSLEPPPPPPKFDAPAPVPDEVLPLSGLEIGASDSPVSIAVVPPDLESLIPATTIPLRARIQGSLLQTEFKPKAAVEVDLRHVYQETEVDQKPRALVRTTPLIPAEVQGHAAMLRVVLVLLIGLDGKAESARVMQGSGNPRFDAIVARTVESEWLFSPAVRHGRKVRVLAQQAFRVTFTSGGSPFNMDK